MISDFFIYSNEISILKATRCTFDVLTVSRRRGLFKKIASLVIALKCIEIGRLKATGNKKNDRKETSYENGTN